MGLFCFLFKLTLDLSQFKFTKGSDQIDVKMSFKGRHPSLNRPANPLCPCVSPTTHLHTKTNVIFDARRSLKGLSSLLRMRKKESTKHLFIVMEATETADLRLIHRYSFRPQQIA